MDSEDAALNVRFPESEYIGGELLQPSVTNPDTFLTPIPVK